ncbi:MAG: GerMN domain-containing protein [Cyanobacteriota bacterium]|nr:GerMN domain-containing protein [Cyanobacteriota bacterium]
MNYPVDTRSRRIPAKGSPPLPMALLGFVAGIGLMSAGWWLSIGPRQTLSLYWLTSNDNQIYYVEQERSFRAAHLAEALQAALDQLIRGPQEAHLSSTLPPDTRLLDIKVEGDDIFLNFSEAFTSGGGSTSMMGRITQVLYTATSHNPQAKVWLSVEGKALTVLGGEGLMIEQPLTREALPPNFGQMSPDMNSPEQWSEVEQQQAKQP